MRKPVQLLGYAEGNYMFVCRTCGETNHYGDKRAFQCLPCAVDEANGALTRMKALELEVEAIKEFGGGFYSDAVSDETRQFYRAGVQRRQSEAMMRTISQSLTEQQ